MGYEELQVLAESYRPRERESLFELAQVYRSRDEQEILKLAALAADISLDSVLNLGLEPEEDPRFREAFKQQYPNVDIETLRGASEERLAGYENGVKGKYFEMLVRDRLNAGERVGELQLLPGQTAHIAESSTQPGWDVVVVNQDGSTDELLQFKATESMGYVTEALAKHPDIRVVVPSEVDDRADDVLGTDISNEHLDSIAQNQIGEMGETVVEDLLDKGTEAAFDSIPFATMIATGVVEGGRVLTGRSTLRESFRRGARRMGRTGVYNIIGAALGPTGVAVPVVMGLRVVEGRVTRRVALSDHLESRTLELGRLTASAA